MWLLAAALTAGCGSANQPEQAANPAAAVENPVNPATAGALTGTISFSGVPPAPETLKMSSDPQCASTGPAAVSESLLVGDGGGLENVFVYVKDGLGNLTFPVPATAVQLDQKGCRYAPHVFGVQVGQPVEILNSDPTLHNVHAVANTNREFNTGFPSLGMKMTHTFTAREVMVPIKCDVHKWMNAWVGVLDHPFFAVSGAAGTFDIPGLPPGTYTIEAWHETLGSQTQTVTIGEKETRTVTFTFAS